MIIVAITGPTMRRAIEQISQSSKFADLVELRLDLIQEPPLGMLMASTKKPIIATCRPVWEGGSFGGSESERIEILEAASEIGARYIDVELASNKSVVETFRNRKQPIIISHHRFSAGKVNIEKLYGQMRATDASVLKFAYTAHDAADILPAIQFLDLARRDKQKAVAIAMGEYGEPTRILYRKFGGWATYASAEDGNPSALGQVLVSELKDLYRSTQITRRTKIFGVIGNPLKQSRGIYLHNPLFRRAKMDAVYCRFQVRNVTSFMKTVAPMLSGFSITLPHKQSVIKHLHQVDETAKAIGAVNTVIRKRGKLLGTNTDASGALDAIERTTRVRSKRMLIIGAGGTARAIAFEAKRRGAAVFITNRTPEKAEKLAKQFGLTSIGRTDVQRSEFDIIVNATSVGMSPRVDKSPLLGKVLKNSLVFDAVYNPPITKLLRDAKSVGAKIVQGTEMFYNQAALQSQLYTGIRPRISTIKKILQ